MSNTFRKSFTLGLIFLAGIVIGLAVWTRIQLPYSNPGHAVGLQSIQRFNPTTNSVRFVLFIILPSVLLIAVALLRRRHGWNLCADNGLHQPDERVPELYSSRTIYIVITLLLLAVVSHYTHLSPPPGNLPPPRIDHFHDGEALGAAVSYEHGLIPYRDFYIARGVLQDPGKVLLAFSLFGRSPGSVRTLESIQLLITFLALGGLALLMFRGNFLASSIFAALYALYTVIGSMTPSRLWERDLLCLLYLMAILVISRTDTAADPRRRSGSWLVSASSFLIGFLPSAGFAFTLDRGFFLTTITVILWPILAFVILSRRADRLRFIGFSLSGIVAGILVLGMVMRWHYADFARYCFVQMPAYKEFIDGMEFVTTNTHLIAGLYRTYVLVLFAAAIFWMACRLVNVLSENRSSFMDKLKFFIRGYLFEIALLLMAIVCFRYGLGRSDRPHIACAAAYLMIFLTYIFIRYYLPGLSSRFLPHRWITRSLILLIAGILAFDGYRFLAHDVLLQAYPLRRTTDQMLTEDYRELIAYLKPRISERAQFVTLTNEASLYYLLDQPSPLIFPEVWFGGTDYFQKEMVQQLERKPVQYILYHNDAPWNNIDGIENRVRLPILFNYVESHYLPFEKIGPHEIWIRNPPYVMSDATRHD